MTLLTHYIIINITRILQERIASLESNEKRLVADIKKRGDLARNMIQEKDNEIIEIKKLINNNDSKTTSGYSNSYNNTNTTKTNNDVSKIISHDNTTTTNNDNINTEQSYIYLRQAFMGFVKARNDTELENLGRVVVALLSYDDREKQDVLQAITIMGKNIAYYYY